MAGAKPLQDTVEPAPAGLVRRAVTHLRPFVLPRWKALPVAVVALLAATAFEVLKPWPLKFVFDYLLAGRSFLPAGLVPAGGDDRLWMLVIVCVLIILIATMAGTAAFYREYVLKRLGEQVAFDLRTALFSHLQRLSLRFHDNRRLGDVITRVTGDISAVQDLATTSLLQSATAMLTLSGVVIVMFWMDWRLACVVAAMVPVLCPIVWHFKRRIEGASRRRKSQEVEVSSVTQETMSSIRLVKAFGRERLQQNQFGRVSSASTQAGLELARLEAAYVRAVELVIALGTCAVVWFGVHRVWAGSLTLGDLLVFVVYQRGIYGPLKEMAKQSAKIAKGRVGLERVLEIMDLAGGVEDSRGARPAPPLRGAVEFHGVGFEYVPGHRVLTDVRFRAEPGQVVALVGSSGAGKSTILNLIPRLYDATAGRITIDGTDIREFRLQSLRDQISVVLQEAVLLQTTILENVLYGRPDAPEASLREAIAVAGVDELAARLPRGYDTVVGPRGATLSGGERQRVAIARALVRRAPILLLDEPTTGLDVHSEAVVLRALGRLMSGATTLLISHKLSLIEQAHQILVVDAGRIVESGTHKALLKAGGLYARLHARAASSGGIMADERRGLLVEAPGG